MATESIRDRQRQLTEEAVVLALATHVAENGSFDFAISDIAAKAGVSTRTIYNHFGDRQGLLDALSEHAAKELERRGGTDIPDDLHELPSRIRPNFAAMEAIPELSEAFAKLDYGRDPSASRRRRTNRIHQQVKESFPDLPERQSVAVAAIIRSMASSTTWYRLTREHGIDARDAAAVAAWTMQLQIEALDRGDLPTFDSDDPH